MLSHSHPNFPEGLDITPLDLHQRDVFGEEDRQVFDFDQTRAIEQYGIAGRVWEASQLMSHFLSLSAALADAHQEGSGNVSVAFDPGCSIFDTQSDLCIIELGSGTGLLGVHLANLISDSKRIQAQARLILTDLPDVCPLTKDTLHRSRSHSESSYCTEVSHDVEVSVVPLPWGDTDKARELSHHLESKGQGRKTAMTHIICSDLVYFPHLFAPLLRTLIQLTSTPFLSNLVDPSSHTHPQVLISYKIRSLIKESLFWSAFGLWFSFRPVAIRESLDSSSKGPEVSDWRLLGANTRSYGAFVADEDTAFVFVASRRPESYLWPVPDADDDLLAGVGARGTSSSKADETFEALLLMQMTYDGL